MGFSNSVIWALCISIGFLFWLILYFRDKTYTDIHPGWRWLMIVLRSLATGILLYLVLAPLFKSIFTEIKKPLVVIAQDNSQSVMQHTSKENQASYLSDKSKLETSLTTTFEVSSIQFGEKITEGNQPTFTDRATDISAALEYIQNLTAGQNLGAIILATDGNFNQGANPLYSNPNLQVPIYCIAMGDSTPKRDLSLQRTLHNSIVYLGDQFEVQIDLKALDCINEKANLQIFRYENEKETLIKSEIISINSNDWYHTHKFILDANKAGTIRYAAKVNPLSNEYSRDNNIKDFFIEVLDARQKILLLYAAPHPDIAALKKITEKNKNYVLDIKPFEGASPNWNEYSMVLFHQLPGKTQDISIAIRELNKSQKARMFILGSGSDIPRFNNVQSILKINGDSKNMNEVTGEIKESFGLFTPDPNWKPFFKSFPPISAPFGEYQISPAAQTLITQKIGNILTNYPLLTIGEESGARIAVLTAEGIWKWRYYNFLEQKNFDLLDDLILKVIQYIGIKEDKRKFRVSSQQKVFLENQPVTFDAQLFNDSYEMINTDDAFITITSSNKKEYQFTFNKAGNAYSLNAGLFAPGTYTYTAFINTKAGRQEAKGQFIVQQIQLETYQNTADHNLLRLLSNQHGGQVIMPGQISSLAELIKQNNSIKPIQYSSQRTYPIINFRWLFALLAGLLFLEWFLRRYFGGY